MDIPLTKEGFNERKSIGVNFVVVDVLSEGFSRVPYDTVKKASKSTNDAKPLTEKRPWSEDTEGQLSELTCYPYTICEGPGAAQKKGPRVEDWKWSVYPGIFDLILLDASRTLLLIEKNAQAWSSASACGLRHGAEVLPSLKSTRRTSSLQGTPP